MNKKNPTPTSNVDLPLGFMILWMLLCFVLGLVLGLSVSELRYADGYKDGFRGAVIKGVRLF